MTSVSISPTSEVTAVGTTKTIIATVLPSNATNKNVTEYPIAIYYSLFHFAKVTSWNSDGTPKTIEYKMGRAELIKTSGYDVYTDDSYGKPVLYFK